MTTPDPMRPYEVRAITPNTIPELARLTRWNEEELWKQYRRAVQNNTTIMLMVPSEKITWKEQLEIAAAYSRNNCYFNYSRAMPYQDQWVCIIHGEPSDYPVSAHLDQRPCRVKARHEAAQDRSHLGGRTWPWNI